MSIPSKGRVEIDFKYAGFGTTVKVDGVQIPGVVEARIGHRAGAAPRLYLEILPELGAQITGDADIVVVQAHDNPFVQHIPVAKRHEECWWDRLLTRLNIW